MKYRSIGFLPFFQAIYVFLLPFAWILSWYLVTNFSSNSFKFSLFVFCERIMWWQSDTFFLKKSLFFSCKGIFSPFITQVIYAQLPRHQHASPICTTFTPCEDNWCKLLPDALISHIMAFYPMPAVKSISYVLQSHFQEYVLSGRMYSDYN